MQGAIASLFSFQGIFFVLLGTTLGIYVGAIPGLTGTMLIALTLPLTQNMDHELELALMLLISIHVGAVSGGMFTSMLLPMPGTLALIVTTFDGYPMAKNGQPRRALDHGVMASFVGDWILGASGPTDRRSVHQLRTS